MKSFLTATSALTSRIAVGAVVLTMFGAAAGILSAAKGAELEPFAPVADCRDEVSVPSDAAVKMTASNVLADVYRETAALVADPTTNNATRWTAAVTVSASWRTEREFGDTLVAYANDQVGFVLQAALAHKQRVDAAKLLQGEERRKALIALEFESPGYVFTGNSPLQTSAEVIVKAALSSCNVVQSE
jgi:hypothetical protein